MTEKENSTKQEQPSIAINSQYIKDLSLEIPFAPEIFKELNSSPEMDIKIDVDAKHLEGNVFNVELKMEMNSDVNGKKLFVLELTYAAVAVLNVPKEHVEPVLLVEIPRILFPFARSIITNTLVDGGLPPFMLNPIDFASMYAARKQAETEIKN
ncbi:MAG: protein-export chaperone SecB [Lactobacillaceae bacterium]|jgi:preprotein translocase subunit SecB|nr:protein-export chaperone SecB [Lactobacillaceae bacterium]